MSVIIIAVKIKIQPIIIFTENISPKKRNENKEAKTDSRVKIRDARIEEVYFMAIFEIKLAPTVPKTTRYTKPQAAMLPKLLKGGSNMTAKINAITAALPVSITVITIGSMKRT